MTGAMWKEIVLEAAMMVDVYPWVMQEIDNPIQDTRESVNVLLEALPGLSEKEIERALQELEEQEIEPSVEDLQKLADRRNLQMTDEQWELLQAQILEMAMEQLNQVKLLDISPSYHYHD